MSLIHLHSLIQNVLLLVSIIPYIQLGSKDNAENMKLFTLEETELL